MRARFTHRTCTLGTTQTTKASFAPNCTVSGKIPAGCHTLLHACKTATHCKSMAMRPGTRAREQRKRTRHTQQHAKHSAAPRHQLFHLPRAPAANCTRCVHMHATDEWVSDSSVFKTPPLPLEGGGPRSAAPKVGGGPPPAWELSSGGSLLRL